MKLHHLRPAEGSKKRKIRVGRGESGRRGKTAGRGTKGLKARSKVRQGFEGGQTPLQRRIPKLKGFRNPNREEFTVINVGRLGELDAGSTVTPETMREAGLAKKRGKIKVLGEGDISVALTVKAHAFSSGAADKIQSAGGSIEVIES
ncbi:MAG: 50S ribosomal protein L15 [Armatimonadetes bacterium]|nr:MAG: 50S ribosomal protein L15 [Armatimonadota bacterium]